MYLEKVNNPKDIKQLSPVELTAMSGEIRRAILDKLSRLGGHIGPNLGMVEATIAMHYVFDSPSDKIVFDVSHQCYAHKIITGRKESFADGTASGYTNPKESEHDFFNVGHTSTSVSLACGLAKARDLKGGKENVIAVIGDGSLSGGEALEGLNNATEAGTNMIIVVNDNQMSIAENHGGMYANLQRLRENNGVGECNLFKAMGLHYIYVNDGNDVETLIGAFRSVKDAPYPIVVHINTVKGKGYELAELNKERYHWGMPFDLTTGEPLSSAGGEDYASLTARYLLDAMKKDPSVVAITSGTPSVFGFFPAQRAEAGKQFVDVGIAEEHAVALSSGIAAGGAKPVYGVYGTFLQRTYDQLSQDLCINENPAVILVFGAGVYSMRDCTHLGFFDIPLVSNIPNMVYLAPTCREEYFTMLGWAMEQTSHPVAIRVPSNGVIANGIAAEEEYGDLNRFKVTRPGKDVAIIAAGSFYQLGESVADRLKEKSGIEATLINPRYLTGIDVCMLEELKESHGLVVVLEDGVMDGGFGEKIARYYGTSDIKVMCRGLRKEFADRYDLADILSSNRLTEEQIAEDITSCMA